MPKVGEWEMPAGFYRLLTEKKPAVALVPESEVATRIINLAGAYEAGRGQVLQARAARSLPRACIAASSHVP